MKCGHSPALLKNTRNDIEMIAERKYTPSQSYLYGKQLIIMLAQPRASVFAFLLTVPYLFFHLDNMRHRDSAEC